MSVSRIIARVKAHLAAWQDGGAKRAVESARPCPACGCRFRHHHGTYGRFVVAGDQTFEVAIPRLRCPDCGRTAAIPPPCLGPRSPYPYCLRQAAIVTYLAEERGYRPVAADLLLAWQLLWQWVDRLAAQAKVLLAQLSGLLLHYPPPGGTGAAPDLAADVSAYRSKARSPAKQEGLAAIGAMLVQAHRLWKAGAALGLPWGEPDPAELLGFLGVCQKALA